MTVSDFASNSAGVSGIRGVATASGSSSGGWKPPAPPAFSNPGVRVVSRCRRSVCLQ